MNAELPEPQGAVEYVGPIEHHDVVVNGWLVPYLTATPLNGGRVLLSLGHRTCVEITVEESERLVPFMADCIAVALGYTGHPGCDGLDEPRRSWPMARMHHIDLEVPDER